MSFNQPTIISRPEDKPEHLMEKHYVSPTDAMWKECDDICYISKNLYNSCVYKIRQHYFEKKTFVNQIKIVKDKKTGEDKEVNCYIFSFAELYHQMKDTPEFRTAQHAEYHGRRMNTKVLKQTQIQVNQAFSGAYAAIMDYQDHPEKYKERPNFPGYLKTGVKGRNVITFPAEAIQINKIEEKHKHELKEHIGRTRIRLAGTTISFLTHHEITKDTILEVKIVPQSSGYFIHVSYSETGRRERIANKEANKAIRESLNAMNKDHAQTKKAHQEILDKEKAIQKEQKAIEKGELESFTFSKEEMENIKKEAGKVNLVLKEKRKKIAELKATLPRKKQILSQNDTTEEVSKHRRIAGIDLGIRCTAALTSNDPNIRSIIFDGGSVNTKNWVYRRRIARMQSLLESQYVSDKIKDNIRKNIKKERQTRKLWMDTFMHVLSRVIVNRLIETQTTLLVIGYNEGWKDNTAHDKVTGKARMNKKTRFEFAHVPYATLIALLTYKANNAGITVVRVQESHTSKCSFMDNETIGHHDTYMGRRPERGIFIDSQGNTMHADVNGSLNIIRKFTGDTVFQKKNGSFVRGYAGNPVKCFYSKNNFKLKSA